MEPNDTAWLFAVIDACKKYLEFKNWKSEFEKNSILFLFTYFLYVFEILSKVNDLDLRELQHHLVSMKDEWSTIKIFWLKKQWQNNEKKKVKEKRPFTICILGVCNTCFKSFYNLFNSFWPHELFGICAFSGLLNKKIK